MINSPTNLISEPSTLSRLIKEKAQEIGFDQVGITKAVPSLYQEAYRDWIDRGFHGEMAYLERNLERRLDPSELVEGAKSIIVVAENYYSDAEEGPGTPPIDPDRAIFARYARNLDYHDVLFNRLMTLLDYLKEIAGPEAKGRVYVDAGPVLEREVAQRAGIGWFGKNTMLINTRKGSYFFLGEIIVNIELEPDAPAIGGCGTCRKCIDACPTHAIIEPYRIDARRCISYLTIEQKGPIPEEFAPALSTNGNRVYGCDICQEVCPFNIRRAEPTDNPDYQARVSVKTLKVSDIALMEEEEFREVFRKSPVKRAKLRGLRRNADSILNEYSLEKDDHAVITFVE